MPPTSRLPPTLAALADHIAAHPTATQALQSWCATRLPGTGCAVTARILHDHDADAANYVGSLSPAPGERLRHRAIHLTYNSIIVSTAQNWYLPDRLPADIRQKLLTTTIPFGTLIRPLGPHRTVLELGVSAGLLHIRAQVTMQHDIMVAEVDECYAAVLTQAHG